MTETIKNRLITMTICLCIFCLGYGVGYFKAPAKVVYRDVIKEAEPKVVTQTETKTEAQYVPKETNQDADVEITNTNPSVSVNGKKYEMTKLPTETNKFEKGKVTVQQGYEIKIDAKELIPKPPKYEMDIGYSNHGVTTGVGYNFNRNVGIYVEGTPVPKGGKDHFVGAGLRVKF